MCWPDGKVLITAPTAPQIKDIVWSEVRKLAHRIRAKDIVDIPEPALDPATGIVWPDGRRIIGRSTDKPERIQGYSGPACLYLLDEASGIAQDLYEALRGNTAGGAEDDDSAVAKFVLTGNPTKTTGIFYDAFTRLRHMWRRFTISSEETPNAKNGTVSIPGLATRHYCESVLEEAGGDKDSDFYRVRVGGQFPRAGGTQVIPLTHIEAATKRFENAQLEDHVSDRLELGVDVARFGDDASSVRARRGRYAYAKRNCHGFDTQAVTGMVIDLINELKLPGDRQRPLVKVDVIGVGAGVADALRAARDSRGLPVCDVLDVSGSEKSDDEDKYRNKRSQLWFATRDWLETGIIEEDADLERELLAPAYTFTARGQREVEPKKATKKKLGKSPDRADALALAIYSPQSSLSDLSEDDFDDIYGDSKWDR